jgi:CheY-specific phosphatase CheX
MSESLEAVLVGATQSALERTAFLFAEPGAPSTDESADPPPAPFVATVAFTGAHDGAFSIEFPARLLPVLATNVLGEEDLPSAEMQRDALGELANIICGNVLPALDPNGKYSLGSPVVGGAVAAVSGDAVRVAAGDLQIENEKVEAALWLRAPGTAARPA